MATEVKSNKPLSPHLGIWKWTPTMLMSILHRATGIANSIGLIVIIWWLVATATGPDAYESFQNFSSSLIGKLMFMGWTFSVWLHLCSGIRHLIMDTGNLINTKSSDRAIYVIIAASCLFTILTWAHILGFFGQR